MKHTLFRCSPSAQMCASYPGKLTYLFVVTQMTSTLQQVSQTLVMFLTILTIPRHTCLPVQSARLYDINSRTLRAVFQHASPVLSCCFQDDSTAFTGSVDGQLKRWVCASMHMARERSMCFWKRDIAVHYQITARISMQPVFWHLADEALLTSHLNAFSSPQCCLKVTVVPFQSVHVVAQHRIGVQGREEAVIGSHAKAIQCVEFIKERGELC